MKIDKIASVRSMLKLRPLLREVRGMNIPIKRYDVSLKNYKISINGMKEYIKDLSNAKIDLMGKGRIEYGAINIPKSTNRIVRNIQGMMNHKTIPSVNVAHELGHAVNNAGRKAGDYTRRLASNSGRLAEEIRASRFGANYLGGMKRDLPFLNVKKIDKLYRNSIESYRPGTPMKPLNKGFFINDRWW